MVKGYTSRICGTGSFLPARVVRNDEVAQELDLRDEDVFRVTGIRTRHWVDPDGTCSQLAERAARQALSSAGLSSRSLDAILVSTTSPDTIFPSTACYLQRRLKAGNVPAFDLAASCSGFIYGLSMADSFIRSGQFRCCLVVAAEIKSRYLDPSEKSSAMLFGDGAGAAIVARDDALGAIPQRGIMCIRLFSDGAHHQLITVPAGGSKLPASSDTVRDHLHTIQLQGGMVYRVAVKKLGQAIEEILRDFHIKKDDVKQVIMHQANGRMLQTIAKRLGFPKEQMFSIIEQAGNTSSASLPMALDFAHRQGRFGANDLIVLGAFGGGLTWGTALIRW